jgi:hypothetical protein
VEVQRMSTKTRNGHYFVWFILFGVIALLVGLLGGGFNFAKVDPEAYWLLGVGVIGWLLGSKNLNTGSVARYFDYIVGVIFMIAGVIGIVSNYNASLLNSLKSSSAGGFLFPVVNNGVTTFLGLSLALLPAIVNLFLGFFSFRHGMENSAKH